MRTSDWTESVSVLDRVTAVFEAFGEYDEGLGISELARRAHLPKSTVSRIAADLVAQRFLDREGDTLYLGVRLFELGQTVEQPRRLRQLALPIMTDLRDVTGQTVHLAVLDGVDVVFVTIVRAGPIPKPLARVGGRLPAHATALGKAILAFSPKEAVERIAQSGLEALTPQTITEPAALRRELADIRMTGIATELEECAIGRTCTASAILDHVGAPIAAISVTGSVDAATPERVAPAVRGAAIALSRRVGASRKH